MDHICNKRIDLSDVLFLRIMNLEDIELLKIQNLSYASEKSESLAGISFSVKKGEIVGFLGPNGSFEL